MLSSVIWDALFNGLHEMSAAEFQDMVKEFDEQHAGRTPPKLLLGEPAPITFNLTIPQYISARLPLRKLKPAEVKLVSRAEVSKHIVSNHKDENFFLVNISINGEKHANHRMVDMTEAA